MPAEALCDAVDDDVDAVLNGALQIWRHERVVRHRHYAVCLCYLGNSLHVGELHHRVRRRLDVDELRIGLYRLLYGGEIARVDEAALDAVALEDVSEDLVGAPVEGIAGEDMVPLLHDGHRRIADRRHPGGGRAAVLAPLQGGDALLQRPHRGVAQPAVDVAALLPREPRGALLGVLEDKRR